MKGLVFNIQRYSIHDGGGIRTLVFLKGCPLHCPWCCNPESQSTEIERGIIKARCIHCKVCSKSVDECPSGAIVEFGKYMDSDEVVNEVMKDSIFYNTSQGGVTLSGGEVLMQSNFAREILMKLKAFGVSTAIETCGMGSKEALEKVAEYIDLVLFDFKIMDEARAREVLGADINRIKDNMEALVKMKKAVIPRIPLIPGYTMNKKNITEVINFVNNQRIKEVHILPFHQYGSSKYGYIGKSYEMKSVKPPKEEEVEEIKSLMEAHGLKVVVGGL